MKKIILVVSGVLLVGIGFFIGVYWYQFQYNDVCLDLGGGKNPGDYPICVIEKQADEQEAIHSEQKNNEKEVHFCDENGNVYKSEVEARKAGLADAEFGATYCPEYLYEKDLKNRLDKIDATVELNEKQQRELVFNKTYQPVKALNVDERDYFMSYILEVTGNGIVVEKIIKNFPGIKKEDFKNTGELKDSIDFQILLNNILNRTGYEPQNGEHLEDLLNEWQKKKQ